MPEADGLLSSPFFLLLLHAIAASHPDINKYVAILFIYKNHLTNIQSVLKEAVKQVFNPLQSSDSWPLYPGSARS